MIYCNACLAEIDVYEVESDDERVGWCSKWCWETDAQEAWVEMRDTDWKE